MRKFLLTALLIGVFAIYAIAQHFGQGGASVASATPAVPPASSAPASSQSQTQTQTQTSQPAGGSSMGGGSMMNGNQGGMMQYHDGTYTGSVVNVFFGNVQVKVSVKSGKVADVSFLQYPNTHSYSVYVNSVAMPILSKEAIQGQNAQVNIVSGATQTSLGFQQSLAAALTQAKS